MTAPLHDVDLVRLPRRRFSPGQAVLRRVGFALALVVFVALVVLISRDGYVDSAGGEISLLDAIYYGSVTTTTTGYGDISAVSPSARLMATLLITPARILFLILVVGTTVEVLTDQSRTLIATRRWRKRVRNHYVICGFGSTGQAAAADLLARGVKKEEIVVVDASPAALEVAAEQEFVSVEGDATKNAVLEQAGIIDARKVVVAPNRDDTAVLITLTVRELNKTAHIVAGGREQENLHLLRQGGADEVIDATAAVGRMLGLATHTPEAVGVLDDLIAAGTGIELAEIELAQGQRPPAGCAIVAVIRNGKRMSLHDIDADALVVGDRLIIVRETGLPAEH